MRGARPTSASATSSRCRATGSGRPTRSIATRFSPTGFEEAEGADPAASLGKTRWELAGADPDEDEDWQAHLADLKARRTFRNFLFSYVDPSGSRRHVSTSGVPVFDRGGAFRGYRGTATDETRIVEAFWRAEEAETLLRDAVESISEGFLILDPRRPDRHGERRAFGNSIPTSPRWWRRACPSRTCCAPRSSATSIPTPRGTNRNGSPTRLEDHRDLTGGIIEKLGDGRWVLVTERRMSNGGIAGLKMDITALKKAEAQRDYLAYHDPTTGLPNQMVFTDRLAQAIGRIESSGGALAVVCLELVSLHDIRDSLGLEAGDAAIREVGRRIKNTIARGETVAHIGGGQFLVLCVGIENDAAAMTSIEKLLPPLADSVSHQRQRSAAQDRGRRQHGARRRDRAGRDHPQRDDRHAQGEEPAGAALPVLQRRDDERRRVPREPRERPAARHRERRAVPRLPAAGQHPHLQARRRRGARPLAASGARRDHRRTTSFRSPRRPG